MRTDMVRVVCERPRSNGGVRRPKGERKSLRKQLSGPDGTVPRQNLRRRWTDEPAQKTPNILLGPLRRYALSVVGRPWAEVHREITAVLGDRAGDTGDIKARIRECLEVYLVPPNRVLLVGGKAYWREGHFGHLSRRPVLATEAYVDPRDGIIKRGWGKSQKYKAEEPKLLVTQLGERFFRKRDGVWYELTMRAIPAYAWERVSLANAITGTRVDHRVLLPNVVVDIVLGTLSGRLESVLDWLRRAYGCEKYASARRQLNSREIRQLGLSK